MSVGTWTTTGSGSLPASTVAVIYPADDAGGARRQSGLRSFELPAGDMRQDDAVTPGKASLPSAFVSRWSLDSASTT